MYSLIDTATQFLKYTWQQDDRFSDITPEHIMDSIVNYGQYLKDMIPKKTPLGKYIHKERMIFDLFMNDEIIVFCYDPKDEDPRDDESFYSNNTYGEYTAEAKSFVDDVRILDEFDYREQLIANEYTGGYWDPAIHWVLDKKKLLKTIQKDNSYRRAEHNKRRITVNMKH
jgi:hypothetical protein